MNRLTSVNNTIFPTILSSFLKSLILLLISLSIVPFIIFVLLGDLLCFSSAKSILSTLLLLLLFKHLASTIKHSLVLFL